MGLLTRYIKDKRQYPYYKEFLIIERKVTKNLIENGQKAHTTNALSFMKMTTNVIMFSVSPIREIQIKTTQRFHFSSIRLTKVQKDHRTFNWQNYKETGSLLCEHGNGLSPGEHGNQHSPSGGIWKDLIELHTRVHLVI